MRLADRYTDHRGLRDIYKDADIYCDKYADLQPDKHAELYADVYGDKYGNEHVDSDFYIYCNSNGDAERNA